MLAELLPLGLIDLLKAEGKIFALGQLIQRGGNHDILPVLPAVACNASLIGPGASWPSAFVVAAVLKIRLDGAIPIAVIAMVPALMSVKRVVPVPAGMESLPG